MNAAAARLSSLTKDLRLKWLETKKTWSDARSAEFEAKYMQELFASVDRSLEAISELDKMVTRIRKDCE